MAFNINQVEKVDNGVNNIEVGINIICFSGNKKDIRIGLYICLKFRKEKNLRVKEISKNGNKKYINLSL